MAMRKMMTQSRRVALFALLLVGIGFGSIVLQELPLRQKLASGQWVDVLDGAPPKPKRSYSDVARAARFEVSFSEGATGWKTWRVSVFRPGHPVSDFVLASSSKERPFFQYDTSKTDTIDVVYYQPFEFDTSNYKFGGSIKPGYWNVTLEGHNIKSEPLLRSTGNLVLRLI